MGAAREEILRRRRRNKKRKISRIPLSPMNSRPSSAISVRGEPATSEPFFTPDLPQVRSVTTPTIGSTNSISAHDRRMKFWSCPAAAAAADNKTKETRRHSQISPVRRASMMRNTSYSSGIASHIQQKEEDAHVRKRENRAQLMLRLRRRLLNFGPEHLFTIMDADESGQVDRHELLTGLESLGMHLLGGDFNTVFNELDIDGNGGIEIHELCQFLNTSWSGDDATPEHDHAGQYQLELEEQLQLKIMKKAAKEKRLLAESRAHTAALKQQAAADGNADESSRRVGKYLLNQQIKEERKQMERKQEIKDLSAAIYSSQLFVSVPKTVVRKFIEKSTKHRIRAGQPLFESGDAANICFFIVKGAIELSGARQTQVLEAGAMFGQEAVFFETKRDQGGGKRSARTTDLPPISISSNLDLPKQGGDSANPKITVACNESGMPLRTVTATVPASAGSGCICFGMNKKLADHLVASSDQFKARFLNTRRTFLSQPGAFQVANPMPAGSNPLSPSNQMRRLSQSTRTGW
jgi:hypothetical protein